MTSNIEQLAAIITLGTSNVSNYLRDNALPFPSFDIDGPKTLKIQSAEVERSRLGAIDALQDLLDLLQGPVKTMLPYTCAASLQVIHRHRLAQKVPIGGKISFQDLADQCALHVNDLKRVIRYAISHYRLFIEPEVGFVAHSAGSKLLAEDEDLHAQIGLEYEEFFPSYAKTADALDKFKDHEPYHTGFALAHGSNGTMFDYFHANPGKADQFARAMKCIVHDIPGYSERFLVQDYDWESISPCTVVDVGGSEGHVSKALARSHADLTMIVQDLPQVVNLAQLDANDPLSKRITFQAHDFFTPQPVTADVYLFRWIFHDWPDKYVVRILQNLIPALKPGARVILNESLCPDSIRLPLTLERLVRQLDMIMLTANNSRLRTIEEWQEIFSSADSRFGTMKCIMPEGAALVIMEVIWQG